MILLRNQFTVSSDQYFVVHVESLCQIITGIENPRNVLYDNLFFSSPLLHGKMLDFDVTGTCSGLVLIDHHNEYHIVLTFYMHSTFVNIFADVS